MRLPCVDRYNLTDGNWAWEAGSTLYDTEGTYGTRGTGSVHNTPGAWRAAGGRWRVAGGGCCGAVWCGRWCVVVGGVVGGWRQVHGGWLVAEPHGVVRGVCREAAGGADRWSVAEPHVVVHGVRGM